MKATLTTLTPVHIGSGVTYNRNIDFIQSGNQIGIIDDEKLLGLIGIDNIHQWTAAIDRGGNALKDLLKQKGLNDKKVADYSKRICNLGSKDTSSNQLKEHYFTSMMGPCIPGSSFKGALKTALLNIISTKPILANFNIETLRGGQNFRGEYSWNDTALENRLFGPDANTKSTRFVKIGDFHFKDITTKVYEMRVLNKYTDDWDFKGGSMLFECIPAGAKSESSFTLDHLLLKRNVEKVPENWRGINTDFIKMDIETFCARINDVTSDLIDKELEELEKENLSEAGETMLDNYSVLMDYFNENKLQKNEFFIRIGGNSGWRFTTGDWIKKEGLNISKRNYDSLRLAIQRRDRLNIDVWPKTRKITSDGILFGFVKVKLEA